MEVGLLLGQNANALLPTGGAGRDKVGNLRIRRTLLGKYGFLLEGWHADVWKTKQRRSRVQSIKAKVNKVIAAPEVLFPELADMPMETPRTCPNCVGCSQCQYELQDMTFKEKKELDALRSAVILDSDNNVCRASYPEIDPELPYKDNKWQAVAMSTSLEKQLRRSGMLSVYNGVPGSGQPEVYRTCYSETNL